MENAARRKKGANLTHPNGGTAKHLLKNTPSRAQVGAYSVGLERENSRFSVRPTADAKLLFRADKTPFLQPGQAPITI
jgi:hypothetical protein